METLLITGAGPRGITGKLIKEYFTGKYKILSPSSSELDLTNDTDVIAYFNKYQIDYVIHCATFRPTSNQYFINEELESNLRMYFTLVSQSSKFKKMIYFGSGAEYDKSRDIISIKENDFGNFIPKNKYGLAKYIMNLNAQKSSNIYNFRLFGTINKYERPEKNVIANLCVKAINGLPLKLKQNCRFSFIDIEDILPLLEFTFSHDLVYHDYNLTNGHSILLSEIATIIANLTGNDSLIEFESEGLNKEYTGDNTRIKAEYNFIFTPIQSSIKKVFDYYKINSKDIDLNNLDSRWK